MKDVNSLYKKLWWKRMIEIHKSEKAVREFMAASNKKRKNIAGFTSETAKLAAQKSAEARRADK